RHEIPIPSFTLNEPGSKYGEDTTPLQNASVVAMNGNATLPPRSDSLVASQDAWTAVPASQGMRPRPATIHEGFSFCVGGGFDGLPAWDTQVLQQMQPPNDIMSSRPFSVHHQNFYPTTTMDNSEYLAEYRATHDLTYSSDTWVQKPCDSNLDMPGFDSEMIGQAYTTDEAIPILDLRTSGPPPPPMEGEPIPFDPGNPRRMSGSSFTVSTSGGLSEMTSYEEFSAALSDAPSLTSDYPPPSNRTSMISSTHLSPVASPRITPHGRSELVRTQSRGRASPSPRPGVRAAPYSVEGARNKRWSTGSYGTNSNRRPSGYVYHHPHEAYNIHGHALPHAHAIPRLPSRHSSPTIAQAQLPLSFGNLQAAQQNPYLYSNAPAYPRSSMLVPAPLPSQAFHPEPAHHHPFENPPPLLSHPLFRMLQSNADPHTLHSHYADLSDPPDLYASLNEEQIPPPPEDMNPTDPDLVPHEQELRFEGDLYTPRWVRGHGNKREGWCGICKPGRWLVLKNSAFWYDKSFTHGISAATGNPFQEPQETRRMDGNPDVWEGLCGSCNEWIALVSSKKKGTTWFRHAYKCHTHPKIKDAPKRRRESNNTRSLAAANMAKPGPRPEPVTPHTATAQVVSGSATPTPAKSQPSGQMLQPPPAQQQQSQQPPHHNQEQIQQTQIPHTPHIPPPQIQLQPPPMPPHRARALPPQLHTQVATAPPPRASSLLSPNHGGVPENLSAISGISGVNGIPGVDGFQNMI
ncbi:uncharacterized protein C8A04DRAFT_9403, partial [Dichotomopilus funicola]